MVNTAQRGKLSPPNHFISHSLWDVCMRWQCFQIPKELGDLISYFWTLTYFPRIWGVCQSITTLCYKTNNGCLHIRFNYLLIIFQWKNDDTLINHRLLLLYSRYMQTWRDLNSECQSDPYIHQIILISNLKPMWLEILKVFWVCISKMSYNISLSTLSFFMLENICHVCIYQLHNWKKTMTSTYINLFYYTLAVKGGQMSLL